MIEDKEHDSLTEQNVWLDNFDEAVTVIKRLIDESRNFTGWHWPMNTRCKYINLRIDMRDGGFVLQDRQGNRISLKQLQWQHGEERNAEV